MADIKFGEKKLHPNQQVVDKLLAFAVSCLFRSDEEGTIGCYDHTGDVCRGAMKTLKSIGLSQTDIQELVEQNS